MLVCVSKNGKTPVIASDVDRRLRVVLSSSAGLRKGKKSGTAEDLAFVS